jgi:hypothetical protein
MIEQVANVVVHGRDYVAFWCTTAITHTSRLFDYGIYVDQIEVRID